MEITVKLVRDYGAAAAIHDALYEYNLARTGSERGVYHAKRFPEQFSLVAFDEKGVAHGGIACHWENGPRHVFGDYFYLDDALRGTGVGRRIMEELFRYAEDGGACEIRLTTNTFQAPGFYLKMGFSVVGERVEPVPLCPENIHYTLVRKLRGEGAFGALPEPHKEEHLMELKCPKCGEPILPNDRNPATDLAWCRKCNEGFSCRELTAAACAAASAAGPAELPEHFSLLKKDDAETLRRSPGHALFYLGLMILFGAALCIGGILVNRTAAHKKVYMTVFGAAVALFGVLQVPVSLAGVTVDRKARTLTGGGLFKLRVASFDEIESIESASSSKEKSWFVQVVLKDGTDYALFGDLYAEDAQKLEDFLTERIFS